MATFEDVREHLKTTLNSHNPEEVIAYLKVWAQPGHELLLMLGPGYVHYPSAADLPGRHEQEDGIQLPWRFQSAEAAGQFCNLVEEVFVATGAKCRIDSRAT